MNAVLISIHPKWCELIASGEKTVEVRKTKPKLATPFKVYIYCTKDNAFAEKTLRGFDDKGKPIYYWANKGKVIGEFVCDDITRIINKVGGFILEGRSAFEINTIARASCLDFSDMVHYFGATNNGYAWHISDLVIYDKPKELSEFYQKGKNNIHFYYDYCAGCHYHETPVLAYPCNECDGNRKYLYRPPQSWCYVEEGATDGKAD